MEKKLVKIVFTTLFLFVCQLQADTTWTTGHHAIYDGNTYDEIWMYNDCTLDIFGGDIYRLAAYSTTITNWYNGQMTSLWTRENSIVNIYGGQLNGLSSLDNSTVNLYAYDIVFEPSSGYDDGWIYGKYNNNDMPFAIHLGSNTYEHVIITPEPSSLILLTLGGLLLKKNK